MSKLLICIPFHYNEKQYVHLKKALTRYLKTYDVELNIIIDTNTEQSIDLISKDFKKAIEKNIIQIVVTKNLPHKYLLTWMHREHFRELMGRYDQYLYIEDDIDLPFENFVHYFKAYDFMPPEYVPACVRTEEKDGVLYSTDNQWINVINEKDIVTIDGKRYVTMQNPHHGFWGLPNSILEKNHLQDYWSLGVGDDIQFCACAYLTKYLGKRPLVELTNDNKVSPLCTCVHMSNYYVNCPTDLFATVPMDKLITIEKAVTL